ncbi:hypothetical protein F8388_019671 [Cannabis sativa]|uniref:CCHC-type domain-containing protein n=1 Tax=Cannabis sativa TaxID=3483 RepID=A0A7J6E2J3_CANSA|nr:hypothetical protein F8388_019671 [Cannabis sativa]KAF4370253.1 hypothetical protein G4B88_021727 [Cannabis sativa]
MISIPYQFSISISTMENHHIYRFLVLTNHSYPNFLPMERILKDMSSQIQLTEKEKVVHEIGESSNSAIPTISEWSVFAYVLTHKKINTGAFILQMSDLWSKRFEVTITNRRGYFLVQFGCAGDTQRTLYHQPWHFNNQPIIFVAISNFTIPIESNFTHISLWVQVHGLPFLSKSKVLVDKIGSDMGEFLEVDDESLMEGWGPFMRVRVDMDATQPLLRGTFLKFINMNDSLWVDFKYESLPDFCHKCGRLGHTYLSCLQFLEAEDNSGDTSLPYGVWMKGDPLPRPGVGRPLRGSKANNVAWPLLTRFVRNTIQQALQPPPNTIPASSHQNPIISNITKIPPQLITNTNPHSTAHPSI